MGAQAKKAAMQAQTMAPRRSEVAAVDAFGRIILSPPFLVAGFTVPDSWCLQADVLFVWDKT